MSGIPFFQSYSDSCRWCDWRQNDICYNAIGPTFGQAQPVTTTTTCGNFRPKLKTKGEDQDELITTNYKLHAES